MTREFCIIDSHTTIFCRARVAPLRTGGGLVLAGKRGRAAPTSGPITPGGGLTPGGFGGWFWGLCLGVSLFLSPGPVRAWVAPADTPIHGPVNAVVLNVVSGNALRVLANPWLNVRIAIWSVSPESASPCRGCRPKGLWKPVIRAVSQTGSSLALRTCGPIPHLTAGPAVRSDRTMGGPVGRPGV